MTDRCSQPEHCTWEPWCRINQTCHKAATPMVPAQRDAEFVRMLLWDEFSECCGKPAVGAEYMGQREMVCCGNPEPALLSDAQIVGLLRERFPVKCDGNHGGPACADRECWHK